MLGVPASASVAVFSSFGSSGHSGDNSAPDSSIDSDDAVIWSDDNEQAMEEQDEAGARRRSSIGSAGKRLRPPFAFVSTRITFGRSEPENSYVRKLRIRQIQRRCEIMSQGALHASTAPRRAQAGIRSRPPPALNVARDPAPSCLAA